MESLHLSRQNPTMPGIAESRVGLQMGAIGQYLCSRLPDGRLVMNVNVETPQGTRAADVGWVSNSRMKTMRTEPAWSASPDVAVSIVSMAKSPQQAEDDNHYLLRAGASEAWIIYPDGRLIRHKENHKEFLMADVPDVIPV
jgi:hypothetical protein